MVAQGGAKPIRRKGPARGTLGKVRKFSFLAAAGRGPQDARFSRIGVETVAQRKRSDKEKRFFDFDTFVPFVVQLLLMRLL